MRAFGRSAKACACVMRGFQSFGSTVAEDTQAITSRMRHPDDPATRL